MSHTTSVKTVQYTDVDAIREAVKSLQAKGLKITLLENAKPRMYYENQEGKCDFVIRCDNGQYDVGLKLQADGSYLPVFDEWGGHIANVLGTSRNSAEEAIALFSRQYGEEAIYIEAARQGLAVESVFTDDNGNVQMVLAYN